LDSLLVRSFAPVGVGAEADGELLTKLTIGDFDDAVWIL
jgi:hypothetical protein